MDSVTLWWYHLNGWKWLPRDVGLNLAVSVGCCVCAGLVNWPVGQEGEPLVRFLLLRRLARGVDARLGDARFSRAENPLAKHGQELKRNSLAVSVRDREQCSEN
jgi:hypothetical protein